MPIALLLLKVMKTFKTGMKKFEFWNNIVALEELLIARAKSAFLVHWFGDRLPLQSLYLRVAIANMDALREQYRRVVAASRETSTGLNLTEPLLGMAGTLVGSVLSPGGAITTVYGIIRAAWRVSGTVANILTRIVGTLAALVGGPIVTGLGSVVGILLMPFGLILGIFGGANARPVSIELYELLGALALLMRSATEFINQLMGPRENIRNPLVRQILEVLDVVADLFAQLIGAFAYIVIRVLPLIPPLIIQGIAFVNLVNAVIDFVVFLVVDLSTIPSRYPILPRLGNILYSIIAHLMRIIRHTLTDRLTSVFNFWIEVLRKVYNETATVITQWFEQVRKLFTDVILQHWVIRGIQAAIQQIRTIISIVRPAGTPGATAPASPAPGSPAGGGAGGTTPLGSLAAGILTPPSLPSLPNVADVERRVGMVSIPFGSITALSGSSTAVFELSEQARREVQRVRRSPPSVFAPERQRLRQETGVTPAQAIEGISHEESRVRDLVYTVVGRIMPPEIRARMPQLLDMFRAVDENIYQQTAPAEGPNFPVLDLPDNQQLRPVVRRLEIRASGIESATLNQFKDQLVQALQAQSYVALTGP